MTALSPDGASRWVVVVADAAAAGAAPPGVDGRAYALAMCEDVVELVTDLSIVTPAVVCVPRGDERWAVDVAALCWPGTAVETLRAEDSGEVVLAGLAMAHRLGAHAAAVLAGDAPDLPGLLIGKLFRALGAAEVAVSASSSGDLVALAARLPAAAWLRPDVVRLDAGQLGEHGDGSGGGLEKVRAAAPGPRSVAEGPGWHRLRAPGDVRRLDPGLEGWSSTRALLSAALR